MGTKAVALCLMLLGWMGMAACGEGVRVWITTEDLSRVWDLKTDLEVGPPNSKMGAVRIDPDRRFQTMLGMGGSLEHTTCYNLSILPDAERERVIESLVDPATGAGMNVMRLCIGTPDFTREPWYTYNDLPEGETDPNLEKFSIEKDRAYILPILKLALEKNPDLLFYASPWSPPGWMTSTGDMIGGHLLPEHREAYANYFVKFVQAYEAEGIPIHAVTIQNEPGVDRSLEEDPAWHYPSCRYTPEQERDFIRDHLGPAFERHGIKSEIWCYDHNFNTEATEDGDDPGIDHPTTILSDPEAAKHVDGVAFHGYAGTPEGMTIFHQRFPKVPIYFTEGSTFEVGGAVETIGFLRNWASSYNAWVLFLDEEGKPNNGPFEASRTCITLNADRKSATKHFDYYMYGHFMKFIQRGAVRIGSEGGAGLAHVAFANPDGTTAAVVANPQPTARRVRIETREGALEVEAPGRSVLTAIW